jgi:hypothetical protein
LIVPLAVAQLSEINASIIGSFIREMAWRAARSQPMDNRQRSVIIMDEFQNYAGEALMSKGDPFAEARKYRQQYIIANQYVDQLPRDIQNTVDRNVGTQVTFRVAPEEAAKIHKRYAPLSPEDLVNLPKYHIAARVMASGGLASTVTLKTAPPPPETPYWGQIIERTRRDHARPRAEVEAEILERHKPPDGKQKPQLGEVE